MEYNFYDLGIYDLGLVGKLLKKHVFTLKSKIISLVTKFERGFNLLGEVRFV